VSEEIHILSFPLFRKKIHIIWKILPSFYCHFHYETAFCFVIFMVTDVFPVQVFEETKASATMPKLANF